MLMYEIVRFHPFINSSRKLPKYRLHCTEEEQQEEERRRYSRGRSKMRKRRRKEEEEQQEEDFTCLIFI